MRNYYMKKGLQNIKNNLLYSHKQTILNGGFNLHNLIGPFGGTVGGWKELTRVTAGSEVDTLTASSLSNKRYYMVLSSLLNNGQIRTGYRLGNGSASSGADYAQRSQYNGEAEATAASQTGMNYFDNNNPIFAVGFIPNYSSKEKLLLGNLVGQSVAGAGTAPTRQEFVGKYAYTSNPIDVIQNYNSESGGFTTGSELVVLEYDPLDTHTDNFFEPLFSPVVLGGDADNLSSGSFTAKKYMWIQAYLKDSGGSIYSRLSFNNDAASGNYAFRRSYDGAADATGTSQNQIADLLASASYPHFLNMFIINISSKEKLVIGYTVGQNTAGAGNAPLSCAWTAKWINTSTQITEIDLDNTGAGSYGSGSVLAGWGHD